MTMKSEVRLADSDQQRTTEILDEVTGDLAELAALLFDALYPDTDRPVQVANAVFKATHGAQVLVIVDGEGNCVAYDSAAGVCRPCTGDELSSHA
ncbi:hypothetical protein ACWDTI_24280 [Gordonia sp. NPDC003424]